jgi:hypothetical protein
MNLWRGNDKARVRVRFAVASFIAILLTLLFIIFAFV